MSIQELGCFGQLKDPTAKLRVENVLHEISSLTVNPETGEVPVEQMPSLVRVHFAGREPSGKFGEVLLACRELIFPAGQKQPFVSLTALQRVLDKNHQTGRVGAKSDDSCSRLFRDRFPSVKLYKQNVEWLLTTKRRGWRQVVL